ncbi:MAG: sulfatase-like hydrolase/transferase [Sphaerochaeta sp.]|nr:sulfatase-like hydrolase/transferase [Sphaerochaeta sp.]
MQQVWDTFGEEDIKKIRRYYYSYCTLVDLQIGRMLKMLKDLNLYDDTLIIFLSDHGDMLGSHKLFAKGVPCFEEAYKLPLFFKFPNNNPSSSVCDGYISGNDIAPTLLDILGCRPLGNRIDGHSVKNMLEGKGIGENTHCMAEFFGQRYGFTQRITWKDNFKYVFNPFDCDELYDLNKDPHELVNQIDNPDYQEKVIELATLMQKIIFDTKDDTMIETQYYMTRLAPVGPYKKKDEDEYAIYNKKF